MYTCCFLFLNDSNFKRLPNELKMISHDVSSNDTNRNNHGNYGAKPQISTSDCLLNTNREIKCSFCHESHSSSKCNNNTNNINTFGNEKGELKEFAIV